uniref:Uncharacterized protein n=1 Tax=Brassica oleracea TaxID=3712 RepID=A0A3P6FC60_BRAOL|nr:unnamed protein product [Brassica oleracea]
MKFIINIYFFLINATQNYILIGMYVGVATVGVFIKWYTHTIASWA